MAQIAVAWGFLYSLFFLSQNTFVPKLPISHADIVLPPRNKRIFICCDGTGRDAIRERNDFVTNVARFTRCLKGTSKDGTLQLVYYHEGIAMHGGNFLVREAATGQGTHTVIQDAYYFLCLNYIPGDEIHLIGFSRGAFAVRALACFIEDVGILHKTRLALLPMIYRLWKSQDLERLEPHIKTWKAKGHLNTDLEIMSCAAWDTVSAMLPAKDLAFVASRVPRNLRHAFQALSLHETRIAFPPILWNAENAGSTNFKQYWLAGDHSDIGGGHADSGLATVSLLWMVAKFREFTDADFEDVMLLDCMTPLYLHWQEKSMFDWEDGTLFNKHEYALQSHVYTRGNIHGSESFTTNFWNLPGQTSEKAREQVMKLGVLENIIPLEPRNRVDLPSENLDISQLSDDDTGTSRADHEGKATTKQNGSKNAKSSITVPAPTTSPPSPSLHHHQSWPAIHFTVRILMSARRQRCHLLSHLSTIRYNGTIVWTDVTNVRGLFEDLPSQWESWMFRQWIKREEEMFGSSKDENEDTERFTRFLYPFRHEGENPRKAFYTPLKRASSTDRSSKIMDANDLLSEGMINVPDLSQSRSSVATSVGSGVKYFLDLDYEGGLPERFWRVKRAGTVGWREVQLRGRIGRVGERREES